MSEIRFNGTELLSRARVSYEKNNKTTAVSSGQSSAAESDLTKAKNAYKIPAHIPGMSDEDFLKSKKPIASNREFPGAISVDNKSIELNTQDLTNTDRLKAAGLKTEQFNKNNIFVYLGQGKDGKDTYGFYSAGFGKGDERFGIKKADENGKVDFSNGGDEPEPFQTKQLESAFKARENFINKNFDNDFNKYKDFEQKRAEIDDLLSDPAIGEEDIVYLNHIKEQMTNSNSIPDGLDNFLNSNKEKLKAIQEKERTEVLGANSQQIEDKNQALNTLTPEQKNQFEYNLERFKALTKGLDAKNPEFEAFVNARNYLTSNKTTPDKQTFLELTRQIQRFDKKLEDHEFRTAINENNKTILDPSNRPDINSPKYEEFTNRLGTVKFDHQINDFPTFDNIPEKPGSSKQSGLFKNKIISPGFSNYYLISKVEGDPKNNEYFLVDNSDPQTPKAAKITPPQGGLLEVGQGLSIDPKNMMFYIQQQIKK